MHENREKIMTKKFTKNISKLKLKTNLYSAIKSEDSEALDGGTSQLSSQREYGEIKMF